MKYLLFLACKFDLDQSERKSSQVNASARKTWPNGVAPSRFRNIKGCFVAIISRSVEKIEICLVGC